MLVNFNTVIERISDKSGHKGLYRSITMLRRDKPRMNIMNSCIVHMIILIFNY